MKLADIASTLNARVENGSPDLEITGVAGIEDAGAGQITFLANPKYAASARTTKASAIILADNFPALSTAMLRSKNPYLTFAQAIELYYKRQKYEQGDQPSQVMHSSRDIRQGAQCGPCA